MNNSIPMQQGLAASNRMNSYLEHQSRKSHNLFEGSSSLEDLIQSCVGHQNLQQTDLQQMEQWLKRSTESLELAIARVRAAGIDDDLPAEALNVHQ